MIVYFAELDSSNVVQRIEIINSEDILSDDMESISESKGEAKCQELFGGSITWKRPYRDGTRKRFAVPNGSYSPTDDAFLKLKPFSYFVLNSDKEWQPPIAKPTLTSQEEADEYFYIWDDSAYQADNTQGWTLYRQENGIFNNGGE